MLPAFPLFASGEHVLWACHQWQLSPLCPASVWAHLGLGEWHQHFAPMFGTGIPDTLGMESAGASPLSAMACSWVVTNIPRMVGRGIPPVRSCRGYKSAPWVLGGQAHMAAPKVSTKAWQPHPSSAFTSHSSASTLSCELVVWQSLWLCGTPQPLLWHQ